jgi:hypothetical protein
MGNIKELFNRHYDSNEIWQKQILDSLISSKGLLIDISNKYIEKEQIIDTQYIDSAYNHQTIYKHKIIFKDLQVVNFLISISQNQLESQQPNFYNSTFNKFVIDIPINKDIWNNITIELNNTKINSEKLANYLLYTGENYFTLSLDDPNCFMSFYSYKKIDTSDGLKLKIKVNNISNELNKLICNKYIGLSNFYADFLVNFFNESIVESCKMLHQEQDYYFNTHKIEIDKKYLIKDLLEINGSNDLFILHHRLINYYDNNLFMSLNYRGYNEFGSLSRKIDNSFIKKNESQIKNLSKFLKTHRIEDLLNKHLK